MTKIERKPFGYKLTFAGFIKRDEMEAWYEDSQNALQNQMKDFGVFIDMRELKTLPKESQEPMQKGQMLFKTKGMQRSVCILNDSITAMQFKRIAKQTGIYEWERYLDASAVKDWEKVGVDWIQRSIDPDQ